MESSKKWKDASREGVVGFTFRGKEGSLIALTNPGKEGLCTSIRLGVEMTLGLGVSKDDFHALLEQDMVASWEKQNAPPLILIELSRETQALLNLRLAKLAEGA